MLALSAATPVRRARHRLRTRVFEYPGLYLPIARHRYPGPSPQVVSSATELVIDGYFRSANTFAVYAFQLSQGRPVRLAHHLHAPAQFITAARDGIPALLLIREPRGAVLSELLYEPQVALPDALVQYTRFYRCLRPYLDSFVVGEFEQVTSDFGAVIRRLNARFGTDFGEFAHTEDSMQECFGLMSFRGTLSGTVLGFESGVVSHDRLDRELPELARQPQPPELRQAWVPTRERSRLKQALGDQWQRPELARLRDRAQDIYREFSRRAAPPARPR
jgi:hypothetical protein